MPIDSASRRGAHARAIDAAGVWARGIPVAVALAGLVLLPASAGCRASATVPSAQPMKLVIASSQLPGSAGIYVAAEKGFFRDADLDVSIRGYASGKLAMAEVMGGRADLATAADTPIAAAVLDGQDPVVVGTVCEIDSVNVIVARRDRGIARAEDLVGKRVGVLGGTSAEFFLHVYLVTSGIDPARVHIVKVSASEIVRALVDGEVDAAAVFEPTTSEALDRVGSSAVVLDQPGLLTTSWNIVTRRLTAARDRDALVRFFRAMTRANEYVVAHPAESRLITSRYTGIRAQSLASSWSGYHFTLKLDQTLLLSLEDQARWMSGSGVTPDFLDHVDPAILRAVVPENVDIVEPKD